MITALWALALAAQQADPGPPLELNAVLASVEAHHPLLEAAAADLAAADAERMQAAGGFDAALKTKAATLVGPYTSAVVDAWVEQPTPVWGASLFGGYRIAQGKLPPYEDKQETNSGGEWRAGATVPLWRNGPRDRRRTAVDRAEADYGAAAAARALQVLDLKRQASLRYWDWVAQGRRLQLAQEQLELARARGVQLHARAAQGDVPPLEVVDNDRAVASRENRLALAERAVKQAAIELSLFLRDGSGAPRVVDAALLPPPPAANASRTLQVDAGAALAQATERRPDLQRIRAQRRAAELEKALADSQVAPGIDLGVQVSADLGAGTPSRNAPLLESTLAVDLPIPLRASRGRQGVTAAQLRRIEAVERFTVERVAAELQDAFSALAAAEARVEATAREVEAAHAVEEAERARLSMGDGTVLLVNLREQASVDARLQQIDAWLEQDRARVALAAATGALAEEQGR